MLGVYSQTISSIETDKFNPTAKLVYWYEKNPIVYLLQLLYFYCDFSNSSTFFIQLSSAKLLVLVQSWIS